MSLSVNPQLLLSCLERFENQAHNVINDDQSIEFFCREVIPFLEKNLTIDALRKHWKENYTYLNQQVEKTSTQALLETTETIRN